jgi:hypothetical protein
LPVDRKSRWTGDRNLDRALQHQVPGRGPCGDRIAHAERGIEQAALRRVVQCLRVANALEVEDDVDPVAGDRGPAEGAQTESLVEVLDRAVEKSAAVFHRAEGSVDAPVLGQLVVEGHIEQPQLEIDEIGLAGQGADRGDVGGPRWRRPGSDSRYCCTFGLITQVFW